MSTPQSITSEIQKLAPSAVIELFEVDATGVGFEVLRFHAGTNGLNADIVWNGQTFTRYPIEASGFEFNGQGQLPRPRLKASNYLSSLTALLLQYEDLVGSKVTRRRTLAKYLDAVNFPGGVNPSADSTAEFPSDVYFIDRKAQETRDVVEFELISALDLAGVQIPKRQIIQNLCTWNYRSAECSYAGPRFFDINDTPIVTAATAEAQAVIDTHADMVNAKATLLDSERALIVASQGVADSQSTVKIGDLYSWSGIPLLPGTSVVGIYANTFNQNGTVWGSLYNGLNVTLGTEYRRGAYVTTFNYSNNGTFQYSLLLYRIERYGIDSGAVSSAAATYTSAKATRDSAKATYLSAVSANDAALAALPSDDPIFQLDRCGKRLTSCKLRFGNNVDLPFGGFPGASLFR